MSGTPKRSHEEVGHSSTSKHAHEEIGGTYPKLASGVVSSEYNQPYELGPDGRVVKIPRTESRDVDRRSPMHSIYRVPSDSHVESHAVASESKLESRDLKDSREHRDSRSDVRELHGEAKRDLQGFKGEKDNRIETRGDDGQETKYERDGSIDPKNDVKGERDWSNLVTSHAQLNLKDPKELLRGKRYSESPGVHIDPWHISRGSSQGPVDFPKGTVVEDRDYAEAHEAIGENKFDPFKEKDRKKKDVKHREWGDRDKESGERRSTMQVGNSSSDGKELGKEEKEMEKWEKEKKERENLKEREKEQTKRETTNAVKKEALPNEKESGDGSAKMPELENPYAEQKKQKDFDGFKNDREAKDRRKERDGDVEADRTDKQSRLYEKESDDVLAEGEGPVERDKEASNHGAQQRRRMLRPRGSPQLVNRDPRFRDRMQDNEGSQGKSEVSSFVYKVGECMQDLVKLWKEYESSQSDKNGVSTYDGPTLEIRIPAEHVTATNRQVRGGQLWGTDIYTNDSDLVAVLMHTGYCRPTAAPPPSAIQELRATIRVLPPQDGYTSMLRNNVRSRAWGAGIGCSYRVERCCILKKGGGTIDLEPCLTHTSAVEPTLAPVAVERTMTTRAAASNALRQQRFVREVTIQYNLCNEPWIKYSIGVVADKGLKKPLYTSARLKKGEVLYLETHTCRYELCFTGEKLVKAAHGSQGHEDTEKFHIHHPHSSNGERNDFNNVLIDSFRWSRCKRPLPQKILRSVGIPLPPEYIEILEENLEWEDVQWSQTGVWIAGKEYALARVHFLSPN